MGVTIDSGGNLPLHLRDGLPQATFEPLVGRGCVRHRPQDWTTFVTDLHKPGQRLTQQGSRITFAAKPRSRSLEYIFLESLKQCLH